MSKNENVKKDSKKRPMKTMKEKKAAKREKKNLNSSTGYVMDLKLTQS